MQVLSFLALNVAIQIPNTINPAPRPEEWWKKRHAAAIERAKLGNADLAFVGDSITHGWGGGPEKDERFNHGIWDKAFGIYKPINLGFSGDRTQHVLWRLQNGEMDGVRPKVVVIMIGTNNIGSDSPEDIAKGIGSIIDWLHKNQKQAKLVVHAIFPRSPNPDNRPRRRIEDTNRLLEPLVRQKREIYLDINAKFLDEFGVLRPNIMPDYLHPNQEGYKIWAEGVSPMLKRLFQ